MIAFLLLIVIAILLFGASAFVGALSAIFGVLAFVGALIALSSWLGVYPLAAIAVLFGIAVVLSVLGKALYPILEAKQVEKVKREAMQRLKQERIAAVGPKGRLP